MILQAEATGSLTVLLVSLIIGTAAIYAGARLIIDADTGIGRAAVTALLGALAWALVSFFVGWIPFLGPLLTLVAWIGVINWQYPGPGRPPQASGLSPGSCRSPRLSR